MINYIFWITAGAFIGGMATLITRRRHSILLLNMIVGSVCAFVAGYFLLPLLKINTTSLSLPGLLVVMGSTIILLAVVNFFVREHTAANAVIEDNWNYLHYKIRARWSKITKDDVEQINGNHDRFVGLIEKRYGVFKVEAEDQLQRFLRAVISKV